MTETKSARLIHFQPDNITEPVCGCGPQQAPVWWTERVAEINCADCLALGPFETHAVKWNERKTSPDTALCGLELAYGKTADRFVSYDPGVVTCDTCARAALSELVARELDRVHCYDGDRHQEVYRGELSEQGRHLWKCARCETTGSNRYPKDFTPHTNFQKNKDYLVLGFDRDDGFFVAGAYSNRNSALQNITKLNGIAVVNLLFVGAVVEQDNNKPAPELTEAMRRSIY